jgi:hypothetical protein
MNKQIEALLIERRGYEQRGLKDRVAAVDEQLHKLGYHHKSVTVETETATVAPQVERSIRSKTKKREV